MNEWMVTGSACSPLPWILLIYNVPRHTPDSDLNQKAVFLCFSQCFATSYIYLTTMAWTKNILVFFNVLHHGPNFERREKCINNWLFGEREVGERKTNQLFKMGSEVNNGWEFLQKRTYSSAKEGQTGILAKFYQLIHLSLAHTIQTERVEIDRGPFTLYKIQYNSKYKYKKPKWILISVW